ncbi:uncharacterized protein LOC124429688 [Vespa crabro]|uniref:uncharacterized protein LOC124429688 n=1 Tax=Vespa crabro TaxID=7445 RepID=UPI001F01314D|nr:uncharacterized protein LOC124429688 [Vespa crabro]
MLFMVKICAAVLGCDCGGAITNITTLSLLDTKDHDAPTETPNSIMASHVSVVQNGKRVYMLDMSWESYKAVLNTAILGITSTLQISGLNINTTEHRIDTLTGSIFTVGRIYLYWNAIRRPIWHFGRHSNARIFDDQPRRILCTVKINDNDVILRQGTKCAFMEGTCITDEKGNAFWKTDSACNFEHFNVLYEGLATKLTVLRKAEVFYTLTTHDVKLALEIIYAVTHY